MARFYGEMQGNRGMASRMGTPASGFWGHIRGWNVGVHVELCAHAGGPHSPDAVYVSRTAGSNGGSSSHDVVAFVEGKATRYIGDDIFDRVVSALQDAIPALSVPEMDRVAKVVTRELGKGE